MGGEGTVPARPPLCWEQVARRLRSQGRGLAGELGAVGCWRSPWPKVRAGGVSGPHLWSSFVVPFGSPATRSGCTEVVQHPRCVWCWDAHQYASGSVCPWRLGGKVFRGDETRSLFPSVLKSGEICQRTASGSAAWCWLPPGRSWGLLPDIAAGSQAGWAEGC